MVNNWLNIIQDYLLPPTCILCGNPGFDSQDICPPCFNSLQKNISCCYRCAEIFETIHIKPLLCGRCLKNPPAFGETHAPFVYQGIIRHLISQLKFNRQYKNARLLAFLLATHLEKTVEKPELIIPVPLHKKRFHERRFNQSTEIAIHLSRQLKIPLNTESCIRNKNTPHQIDLPATQRHKNITGAFEIIKPIKAYHVAILDDVMTTGSTANELATVLKKHGINRIDIWSCARA